MGSGGINKVSNFYDVSEVVRARLIQLFNMMLHIQFRIKKKTRLLTTSFVGMDRHSTAKFNLSSSVDCSVNDLVVIKMTSVLFSVSLNLFIVTQGLILLRNFSTFFKRCFRFSID